MRRGKAAAIGAVIALLAVICAGCGMQSDDAQGDGYYAAATSMESTPVIDYIVPEQTPNVLVNRLGYQAVGDKEAAVKGSELPAEFRLVDADTGEVVFRGEIERVAYNAEAKLYEGQLRFDEYEEPGNYYLECDRIGRSYTFSIVSGLYIQLFNEVCGGVLEECRQREADWSEVTALLTAYEWYPDLFGDEDGDEIPDVLEEVAVWLQNQDESSAGTQEGALQAALLAKFSYLYQKYDKQLATTCLQRASGIFEQSQKTLHKDAESFFALTELYRATGLWTYRNQIGDYKTFFENGGDYLGETEYLYGVMTYMVTRQKVDVELCNLFIDGLMSRAEELSRSYGDTVAPVTAKNNGAEDVLKRAEQILFVNYVLNSYQYHNILEDFLGYLGGRNVQSVIFYPGEGDSSGYILLLAQLASMPDE